MLSYRHSFHAGNHADVLKHFVLVQLLQYLNQKDKPYWVVDTHAGAGLYALNQAQATKNAEFEDGIAKLLASDELPMPLKDYVQLVKGFNPNGGLQHYPGSPLIAQTLMRRDDRLRLFELHPADSKLLTQNFEHDKQVKIETSDGFAGLKAYLPPPPRRGLVLIDPPYEVKDDYKTVVITLKDALQRFATGTYVVWYPMLQREESLELPDRLKRLPIANWLNVGLQVATPSLDGFGMHGSGLFIINPPWTLLATLKTVMPYLVNVLEQDDGAAYLLEDFGK
jgi:23S rRNA (adenine2030-N6)-methyltransferase